jgi:hypothetical protein
MLNQQTLEKLYAMKLDAMADAFQEQLQSPDMTDLPFEDRFALLVDRLWTWKEERRMKRLIKNAKLKINGCLEDIDYKAPRGLDKSVILRLGQCDWITQAQTCNHNRAYRSGKDIPGLRTGKPGMSYGIFSILHQDSQPISRTGNCQSRRHLSKDYEKAGQGKSAHPG